MGDGFFDDDGTPLNSDLVRVPSLCVACRHRDSPEQEKLCALNRLDPAGEEVFRCGGFSPRTEGCDEKDEEVFYAKAHFLSRGVITICFVTNYVFIMITRLLIVRVVFSGPRRRAIVVGTGEMARRLADVLRTEAGFEPATSGL